MSHTHLSRNQDTSRRNLTGPLRKTRAAKHARLRPRQLRCEPLEDRRLLSVFTYSNDPNPDQPIKDKGTITSQISVLDSFIVGDLNVTLNITHTRDPDLDVFLIAPDNTRVELFTDVGTKTSKNFTNTVLDDAATTSITLGKAPFTGAFRPEGDLSVVEGKQVQGTWKLEITDDTKQSTGTLNSWSINVESAGVPAGDNFIDTNPTMLGNAGRMASSGNITPSRKIVVSDNGDAMAVWLESKGPGDTGPWNAMAARYDADAAGNKWQTPVVIMEGNSSNIGNGLELVGDGVGNYLVVESTIPGATQIRARRYVDGSGWQPVESVGSGNAPFPQASMARGNDGITRAVVAWGDEISLDAKINRLDNFATGSWSGVEMAESLPPTAPVNWSWIDVAMAQDGDFMLVFTLYSPTDPNLLRDAYYRVYRNDAGNPSWDGSEKLLENRPESTNYASLEMNSSGEAMVVWRQATGPGNIPETWGRRWNGLGWDDISPQLIVDSGAGTASSFRPGGVAISENGEAIVLWSQQRDGSAFSNAYVRRHDGTQWGDIIKLETGSLGSVPAGWYLNGNKMNVAMDDAGNAAAVWEQSDGTYINMWASQFDGANWSTAEKLENAALDAVLPSVDMSAGVAQVIWTQSDGSLNHMYSATLPQLALSAPVAPAATMSVTAAALESLYDEPLKQASSAPRVRDDSLRINTARRSESLERVASALAEPVAHRITDDSRWANDNHRQTEVDDLFAQWESDPLQLLSIPDLGM